MEYIQDDYFNSVQKITLIITLSIILSLKSRRYFVMVFLTSKKFIYCNACFKLINMSFIFRQYVQIILEVGTIYSIIYKRQHDIVFSKDEHCRVRHYTSGNTLILQFI